MTITTSAHHHLELLPVYYSITTTSLCIHPCWPRHYSGTKHFKRLPADDSVDSHAPNHQDEPPPTPSPCAASHVSNIVKLPSRHQMLAASPQDLDPPPLAPLHPARRPPTSPTCLVWPPLGPGIGSSFPPNKTKLTLSRMLIPSLPPHRTNRQCPPPSWAMEILDWRERAPFCCNYCTTPCTSQPRNHPPMLPMPCCTAPNRLQAPKTLASGYARVLCSFSRCFHGTVPGRAHIETQFLGDDSRCPCRPSIMTWKNDMQQKQFQHRGPSWPHMRIKSSAQQHRGPAAVFR